MLAASSSARSARSWPSSSRGCATAACACRSPRHYPGAAVERDRHRLHRRGAFRGPSSACCSPSAGRPTWPSPSRRSSTGWPRAWGRRGAVAAMLLIALGIGVVAGFLTVWTGGIGASFVAHSITRFAIFVATGHAGLVKPPGQEPEEAFAASLPPEGWEVVGGPTTEPRAAVAPAHGRGQRGGPGGCRLAGQRHAPRAGRRRTASAGRAVPARPVLRLALPVLRLRRLHRPCDTWTERPRRGVPRAPSTSSSTCAPTRSTALRAPGVAGRPPLGSVYLGGGTPSLLPGRGRRRHCSDASERRSASLPTPR